MPQQSGATSTGNWLAVHTNLTRSTAFRTARFDAVELEEEERDAQAAMRLTMYDDGHGKVHGRFVLDTATGAALRKMILAIAAPKHQAATQGPLGERKPTAERMGQAFGELINRYPVGKLPQAGGLNATLVVTMTLESLMGGLKAAQLDTGQTISASLARRMACEAGIIPAVLGGKSEVLDLGRSRRFHSRAQRIVKLLTAGGCQVDGCDAPPGLTHLLHARAHDPTYQLTPIPGDKFTFHRRT
ncbi:MAG TPA: DUF222 domain-containing protein [Nocardioides sp.]|nr:DUF222 domain-containing protein [Nocardioides sp.]